MNDRIIEFLKHSDGYLSGEEISHRLNLSRAAIWKNIEELRREGYRIIAAPHRGYRLMASPDKLLPSEIQNRLGTKILGKKIIYHDSIDSTMNLAFQLGLEGAQEGTVVCADTQTKGRGRMGRSWISPKGKGVYLSVILRPHLSPTNASQLTLLTAVALSEAIKKVSGIDALIKWPNDLFVGGKKLAGILTELNAEMDHVRFVVIGIGVNVNSSLTMLPPHSISLKTKIKKDISRVELTQEILRSIEWWYERLNSEGFLPITKRWKEFNMTLGRRVRINSGSETVEGEAIDLDEYGGLIIKRDNGTLIKRMSGDVVLI